MKIINLIKSRKTNLQKIKGNKIVTETMYWLTEKDLKKIEKLLKQ